MAQTSDHIKPCNIGNSEAHNRRTHEYLKRINKDRLYIRTDLTPQNSSWESSLMEGKELTAYYNEIARMVKEKTGRAMQTKERTVTNKKNGKTKVVSGSSPLRESVVVCKADTNIDQLRKYCDRCHERWGITALQIFIHLDEGHYGIPGDSSTWKPNCHAHIVWDWMNHETGKSCKLGKVDMSLMQDMVAECLEMERGTRKQETGKAHLERTDFIIAKQKREVEEAANKKKHLDHENQVRERIGAELDNEIARKQDKANRENGNAILSSAARLLGKGRYVDMEKENVTLKERLAGMARKMKMIEQEHRLQLEQASEKQNCHETIIKRQQAEIDQLRKVIEKKDKQMAQLDRLAYPQRYHLSSGAVLDHIFIPNYINPSLHIWTKVGDECFENIKYDIPDEIAKRHFRGELTDEEFVNAIFEPQEQVNEIQAQLLGTAFMLASGGPAQVHVETGDGGSQSNLPWREKKKSTLRR
jgi:hypothetical protein